MGAEAFSTAQAGSQVAEAFKDACEQARYEHGHGGYTGTLAEKHEYTIIAEASGLVRSEAFALASALIDQDDPRILDKWGPAGAIPYRNSGEDPRVVGWVFFGWASS